MSGIRSLVTHALGESGVLLADQKHERLRRDALRTGIQLLPRALSDDGANLLRQMGWSLGLAEPVLPRVLGFGWQQADGLAALAGTPSSFRAEVAHLGALFNLGIALFDFVSDRFPVRAALLLAQVTPEFLEAHLADGQGSTRSSGDAGIDLLVGLIVEFFARCHTLGGERKDRHSLSRIIFAMYGAERFVSEVKRDHGPPTLRVWRELRRKSALPMTTMAQLALLPQPHADEAMRSAARISASLAGNAIWIVDDLADVREDWDAGSWNRPLWLLARGSGDMPADADGALRRIVDSGVAAAEASRLAVSLARLRKLAEEHGSSFLRSVQATVHSWIDLLPD